MKNIENIDFGNLKEIFNKKNFKNLTQNKEALLDLEFYKENLKEVESKEKSKNPTDKFKMSLLIKTAFYLYNIKTAYHKLQKPKKVLKYFKKTFEKAHQILLCYLPQNEKIEPTKMVFDLKFSIDDCNFSYRNSAHLDSTKTLLNIIEIIYFTDLGENQLSNDEPRKALKHFKRVSYTAKEIYKDFPDHPDIIRLPKNLKIAENELNENTERFTDLIEMVEKHKLK
jgi:tetratricopeptide (TPR) repeat protein